MIFYNLTRLCDKYESQTHNQRQNLCHSKRKHIQSYIYIYIYIDI
jgi:hypothetical protein